MDEQTQQRISAALASKSPQQLAEIGEDAFPALVACLAADDRSLVARTTKCIEGLKARITQPLANAIDDPASVVRKPVLELLAVGGDERGVASVRRICESVGTDTNLAVKALGQMLARKRVFAHLSESELQSLAEMPDVKGAVIGTEADRYETSVYYEPRIISCKGIREAAARALLRREETKSARSPKDGTTAPAE